MKFVYPDYYKDFSCIADKCNHNCCIGWEIDIDDDTFDFYKSLNGELGKRLKENISCDGAPHFVLEKNNRCPFLNKNNLCDLILELGDGAVCDICAEHPRFYNEIGERLEVGIGLCCEEAGRLILSGLKPFHLECDEPLESDNEMLILRDKIIAILQNREKSISQRVSEMLSFLDAKMPKKSLGEWVNFLLSLERLDEIWTKALEFLKNNYKTADTCRFDEVMRERETEYEQLLCYFVYRHFCGAENMSTAKSRALFAVLGYKIIHALGASVFTETGTFTFQQQVELARLFCSEIEYSEDNFEKILKEFE